MNAGKNFREALREKPLQIVGVINAYVAMMAKKVGYKALYLSGAGVANSSYGLPDLGMTTLDNVLEDVRRITGAVNLPLLVDIDTGWGGPIMVERTIKEMARAGAAAVHMEDQPFSKRCGHRSGKEVISTTEMVDKIKAAVNAKPDSSFVVMARTDSFAIEGLEKMIERAISYRDAGADMLFAEALTDLEQYKVVKKAVGIPLLANMTEFGKTPLYTTKELANAGVDMVLYPLSANRAMNLAALKLLQTTRNEGTQLSLLDQMQTREELYGFLDYETFEKRFDDLIGDKK